MILRLQNLITSGRDFTVSIRQAGTSGFQRRPLISVDDMGVTVGPGAGQVARYSEAFVPWTSIASLVVDCEAVEELHPHDPDDDACGSYAETSVED